VAKELYPVETAGKSPFDPLQGKCLQEKSKGILQLLSELTAVQLKLEAFALAVIDHALFAAD
jgi:hypothetical protein